MSLSEQKKMVKSTNLDIHLQLFEELKKLIVDVSGDVVSWK